MSSKIYKQKIIERIIQLEEEEINSADDFVEIKLPRKYKLNNGDWIVMFQKSVLEISRNCKLNNAAHKVLLYFIGAVEIGNWCYTELKTLSNELNIAKPHVSTAIKNLSEQNILVKENYLGNGKSGIRVRLNYDLAYKGKFKDFTKVQKKDLPILSNSDSTKKFVGTIKFPI